MFFTRDPEVLIKAYCTYVWSILEYCTPIWSPNHTGLNDKLEYVQRRFTKRINGLSCLFYEDHLVHLKLDSLRVKRIKQDMIMCYKTINGLVAMNCSDFFSFNNFRTRGHNLSCTCQNADLTRVSLALLEEFASQGTIYHLMLSTLSVWTHSSVNWLMFVLYYYLFWQSYIIVQMNMTTNVNLFE